MSSRESRAVSRGSARRRRRSNDKDPPNMSDLRIVLLGKSVSENSRVGNFILGRAAFDSEAPPDVVERVGGRLKDRRVTVINSPQLLNTHISDHQITQAVRECVSLSDPGPHAFILVLQYKDFTEEDMRRVKQVLEKFSEEAIKRTIVITTDEDKLRAKGASVKADEFIQQFTEECGGGHFQLDHEIQTQFSGILQQLEKILRENREDFLTCEPCHDAEETKDEDLSRTFASLRTEEDGGVRATRQQKMNVVLCGSDETLKNSVSKLIRKKKDVDLHGRVISVLELPALFNTRLSEEEVMRQTLRCVSLCHPGVHVFLLIIPDSLNNEDKAEMEEIQRIFSLRINKHMMILIMQNSEHQTEELNEETQSVIERFGGRHHFFGPSTRVSTLMENIEQMLEENRGEFFSTETFLESQMKKTLKSESLETPFQLQVCGTEMEGANMMFNQHLKLVLLGKTRAGKSASGNTILGRQAFMSKKGSRSVTQDVSVEYGTVDGFPVTVYDTPGLFNTHLTEEEIQQMINEKVLQRCESGLCAFLLVIKPDRFTDKERETVEKIEELLGEERLKKTWILFTRGDELEEENTTIKEFINDTEPLKNLVQKYDQRYHVFNNEIKGHTGQVKMLLIKIREEMLKVNPLMRKIPDNIEPDAPVSSPSSRRIVLLGKSGAGRSAAGNTILGQKVFKSEMRMNAVTRKCSAAHATVSGRSVSVVDTPGFFHTQMRHEELAKEIARSVYISSPGPHAFLIVFAVIDRFTEHELHILQMIKMMFGEEVLKYSIILLTNGDLLRGESVEELIEENCVLRDLVDQCGGRFHVFSNKDVNNRDQVNDLLKKIDTMIDQNGGGHYSNQMYEDAERFRREEEEEEQRQRDKEEWRQRDKEEWRQRDKEEWRQRDKEEWRQREEERRQQKNTCVCS